MVNSLRYAMAICASLTLSACSGDTPLPAFANVDRIVITQPKYKGPAEPNIADPILIQQLVALINNERTSESWSGFWRSHTYHPCTIQLNLYAGTYRLGHFAYNIKGKHFITATEGAKFPPEHNTTLQGTLRLSAARP